MNANSHIHTSGVEYHRIDNDYNGNPRYVIHWMSIGNTYTEALQFSRRFGGKKYRAKWFGGGIVFQSYNIDGKIDDMLATKWNEGLK